MRCTAHPEVETNLTCSKCGKPICPKCLVQTPVGARCRKCAHLSKLPTYQVPLHYYLRATGAALGLAVAIGLIWGVLQSLLPFLYLNLLLASGVGYAIGEAIGRSVNRKRGRGLAIVAGAAVVISFVVNMLTFGSIPSGLLNIGLDIVAVALGIVVAANRLR